MVAQIRPAPQDMAHSTLHFSDTVSAGKADVGVLPRTGREKAFLRECKDQWILRQRGRVHGRQCHSCRRFLYTYACLKRLPEVTIGMGLPAWLGFNSGSKVDQKDLRITLPR